MKKLRKKLGLQLLSSGRIAPEIKIEIDPPYDKFNYDKIRLELEINKKENFYLKYMIEILKLRGQEKVAEEKYMIEILKLRGQEKVAEESKVPETNKN